MTEEVKPDRRQQEAIDAIVQSDDSFALTGGPGTGKTTTLHRAIQELGESNQTFLLLAPTGKAALRMQQKARHPASTIHRFLWSRDMEERLARTRVVIIDEASMADTETLGQLASLMTNHGCRVVLVGDPNQLPPVGPGAPFEDAIRSGKMPNVHLETIYRQKGDSWVVDNAYRVLAGEMVDLKDTHDFRFISTTGTGVSIAEASLQWLAEKYAHSTPADFQILSPQRKDADNYDTGATTQRINKLVQDRTQSPGGRFSLPWGEVFREGDRVIQTRNNYDANIVNGQMGEITSAHEDGLTVRFDGEGESVYYSDVALVSDNGRPPPSPRDLDLAYAVTVHKSQGSEWDSICFIADHRHKRMLQRRLFYTAITRTKNKLTIIGTEEAVAHAVRVSDVEQRNTLLAQKMKGEVALYGSSDFDPCA